MAAHASGGPVRGMEGAMPEAARNGSLADRFWAWRDGLLASPKFREWAASFPFTRPIARRRARQLFDLCAGFVYSQVLAACVRLRVFDHLAEGPMTADALSARIKLTPEATERLLRAAGALRLAAPRGGGRYGLGELGATLVGNEALVSLIEHHAQFYSDLDDPVQLLREGGTATRMARYWAYAQSEAPSELDAERTASYSRLMTASQALIASEILSAYPLDWHRCLMDVGGGEGGFLAAAARSQAALQVHLFDLPSVAARGGERLRAEGFGDRARVTGGDFFRDPLPRGADVVSLVRVIHDHNDAAVLGLLRAVRAALPDGGTLLLAEPMADAEGAEPVGDAYFGFYLLAMGQGRARSASELSAMLIEAGFKSTELVRTRMPLQTGLLVARC